MARMKVLPGLLGPLASVPAVALLVTFGCSTADGGGADAGSSDSADGGTGDGNGGTGDGGGGSGESGGGSGDSSGTEPGCDEDSDFAGPLLRDCDLPGACGRCMWEKACASFLFRCAHNEDCVCAAECVAQAGVNAWESCLDQCSLAEIPPGFAEWLKGASDMCYDEGCGVLEDPPVDPGAPSGDSPGAGSDPDCAFDPNLSYHPCNDVLQLESADGSLCARIERRDDGPVGQETTGWTLLDVRVGPLGQVCHIDDPADLCWFFSHHNFAEWLHISCGGLHYDLNIGPGCGKETNPDSKFRLHVFESASPGGEDCPSTADGVCPVVTAMDLFPVD